MPDPRDTPPGEDRSPSDGTVPGQHIGNDTEAAADGDRTRIQEGRPAGPTGTVAEVDPGRTVPAERPVDPAGPPAPPGYEILGELGRGGMGVVYKARQVKLNRTVAIKMILAGGHAGEAERVRFQAEAEAVAALQHPNIVQVYEVGELDGKPYLVLEYCAGGGLEHVARGGPLPPDRAAGLVETLALAVEAAHAAGIVHRDLKPANVLLAADGAPKITDFGLAKRIGSSDGLTATGAVLGTPAYMAPEQAEGKAKWVGPAADVYALGAILYALLAGRPPFQAESAFDTMLQVVSETPVSPRRLNPAVTRDLETVVLKCLEKDAARRYRTAGELAADLRRFLAGEPVAARRAGRGERAWRWVRRHRGSVGLSAAVVLTAVALPVVGLWPRRDAAPPAVGPPVAAGPAAPDEILALVEELDRTDPGWRLEQIDRARRAVPLAANSAAAIDAAAAALPKDFDARLARFIEANDRPPPTAPLPDAARIEKDPAWLLIWKARAAARPLADRPYGRFSINWDRSYFNTLLPHADRTRRVTALLQWDAVSRASAGDGATALADCRGCVNAGRALHDEPGAMSQLVRIACGFVGVRTAERVLAIDTAPDGELKAIQDVIRDEEAAPILRTMARAERGAMHWLFSAAAAGDLPAPPLGSTPDEVENFNRIPKGPAARAAHVWAVRHLTRLVEIAARPPHEQAGPLREWEETIKRDAPTGARIMLPAGGKLGGACRRYTAYTRAADTALAAERYRLASGRWPAALADLVPEYLPAVPADPEDGEPLRFRRLPDGVVVYGIGTDRADGGGAVAPTGPEQAPADFGVRLWDPDRRGRTADRSEPAKK